MPLALQQVWPHAADPHRTLDPEITRSEVAGPARRLFARYDYGREARALTEHRRYEGDP